MKTLKGFHCVVVATMFVCSAAQSQPGNQCPNQIPLLKPPPAAPSGCGSDNRSIPRWASYVDFARVLCVEAKNAPLPVEIGQNLKSLEDTNAGTNTHQVYYALEQVKVPAFQKRLVLAVCGGSGKPLDDGTKVVATNTTLKEETKKELASQLNELTRAMSSLEKTYSLFSTRCPTKQEAEEVRDEYSAVTGAAKLLRDSIRGAWSKAN